MKVEAQGGEESGIYSITNTIDNRVYIGSSLNLVLVISIRIKVINI